MDVRKPMDIRNIRKIFTLSHASKKYIYYYLIYFNYYFTYFIYFTHINTYVLGIF